MENNALQYIRHCKLVIAGSGGEGLDVSGLRITFEVKKADAETPNTATIRVYNMAESTVKRIKNEFDRVILQAGYDSNFGVIFDGNIKQVIFGRESNTDTYVDIFAGDGDDAYNFAIVSTTLAKGSTQQQQVQTCADSFAAHGTGKGYIGGDFTGTKLPRGKVMYGMARDYLRRSAQTTNTSWSVQDGKLQFVERGGMLPGQAVVLTSKSGLIGTPEQTNDGIKADCLLNPLLKIGGLVKIDERSVQEAKLPDTDEKSEANAPASIAADGVYRILTVEYKGDTRGQAWYSSLVCLAVDESAPPGKKVK